MAQHNSPWLASYAPGVPATVDIPDIPVQALLTNAAQRHPKHIAVRMVLKYLPLGLVVQTKLTKVDDVAAAPATSPLTPASKKKK